MKITAEINPLAHLDYNGQPTNINKVVNELNGLLEKKDWWELGKKTDREQNPEIKNIFLTIECKKGELATLPDFVITRLKHKEIK